MCLISDIETGDKTVFSGEVQIAVAEYSSLPPITPKVAHRGLRGGWPPVHRRPWQDFVMGKTFDPSGKWSVVPIIFSTGPPSGRQA